MTLNLSPEFVVPFLFGIAVGIAVQQILERIPGALSATKPSDAGGHTGGDNTKSGEVE